MLKLHFYQTGEQKVDFQVDVRMNDKSKEWEIDVVHRIPFYGGQLVSLARNTANKWEAMRLVDGCNVTSEFEKYIDISVLPLDEHRQYLFTYLDPTYGSDAAVYGMYGRKNEFFFVGSVLKNDPADYQLYTKLFDCSHLSMPDNHALHIGFNLQICNFVVGLNRVVRRNQQVRGNGPLFKRWFEIRMNKEDVGVMYEMYSDDANFAHTIDDIENTNYNFAVYIYRCYISRFVKRQNIQLKKNEYTFLNHCHKDYMAKRQAGETEKITVEKIINELNRLHPENLYHLVSEFRSVDNNPPPPSSSPLKDRKPRFHDPDPKMKRLIGQQSKQKDHVPA